MNLQKHERITLRTMQGLLDQAQLSHKAVRGKKHLQLVVTGPDGGKYKLAIASSPNSDETCLMNMARQQVNQLLRKLGVEADGSLVKRAS